MKHCILWILFLLSALLLFRLPGYTQDGEQMFTQKCGKCHTGGGEAPVFAPVKFASVQWERFFARNKHERKKDISKEISVQEQEIIKKYLMDHAADSDRPIAAGLR